MGMPVSKARYTVDDLEAMPGDGNRYEIIDGELFVTPALRVFHQRAVMRLVARLLPYSESLGLELFSAPTDVRVSQTTQVEPDLLALPQMHDATEETTWIGMSRLLLSVEVLSRRTRRVDREIKRPLYMREGIREYWIIDTRVRTIHIWRPEALTAEILRDSLTWHPVPDRVPLVIDLVEYFREVLGSA